ncbi:MAG: MBL fold metallo-hydrolase [Pseudomonadota bacterium]
MKQSFRKIRRPWVALAFVLVAAVAILSWPRLVDLAIQFQARAIAGRLQTNLLEDGKLHVIVVGSGSPAVDPHRVQACVAVMAGGDFLLFDVGGASAYRLDLLGLPAQDLTAVFFTHLHSDHIADLPLAANLGWRHGRKHHLNVFGPVGTKAVVDGFNQAHHPDIVFRSKNTNAFTAPLARALPVGHDVPTPGETESLAVYEGPSGLRVHAFLVDHRPVEPAFGYRIEYRGRVIVISGDTRRCENVARQARRADVLIHEAYNKKLVDRMLELTSDQGSGAAHENLLAAEARQVRRYHTDPVEAAGIAAEAGVHTLVFTHIIPPLGNRIVRRLVTKPFFMAGVKDVFTGEVLIAEDGTHLTLDPK